MRHHPHWRRRNPISRYVRAHLHRRIFAWLAGSLFVTAVMVGGAMWLAGRGSAASWAQEQQRVLTFASGRFAHVWDDPTERDELASAVARDFVGGVELSGAHGERLARFGPACRGNHWWNLPVRRGGATIGTVRLCPDRPPVHFALMVMIGLGGLALALWLTAGRVSRRLSRPLGELVRVAREIGDGKLTSRVRLGLHEPGEVGVLAEAVNDMAVRIEKQLGDQRELLAAMSHEMRTPLARLRVLVELAREAGVDAKISDGMEREILEADALVGQILASSRLDFAALAPRDLDAATTVRAALERAGVPAERLRAQDQTVRVFADPTLLARALANLIDNAAHHGGAVDEVVVRTAGARTVVEVLDRGPGFAPGEEQRAFEAFRRGASHGTRDAGSLGLGLSLVQRIAVAHGGVARAANRDGGGARVWIELPTRQP